jgi:hypothetical protein
LRRKTHLHCEWLLIKPPSNGPDNVAKAISAAMSAPYIAYLAFGTISAIMMIVKEKPPAAPTPWNTRHMILFELTNALFGEEDNLQLIYGLRSSTPGRKNDKQEKGAHDARFTPDNITQFRPNDNKS